MTWTETLYAPVYAAFGVTAELMIVGGSVLYELVMLDKTAGVEVQLQGAETTSIRPAAVCRMADLSELELTPSDLRNASLSINGASWTVISYYPKPSPMGELDGELYMIFTEGQAEA